MVSLQSQKTKNFDPSSLSIGPALGQKFSDLNSNSHPPQKGQYGYPVMILCQKTGAVSLLFSAVLPLLIFFFLNLAAVFALIHEDARAKKICRETLLSGQQKSLRELNKLMLLNFQAGKLIFEKGKIVTEMTSQPYLAPILGIKLAKVLDKQKKLAQRQKEFIKKSEFHIRKSLETARFNILSGRPRATQIFFFSNSLGQVTPSLRAGVETSFPTDPIAPVYKFSNQLETLQYGAIQWTRKSRFPYLSSHLGSQVLGCAATLVKEDLQPVALLKKVKHPLNSSLY